MRSAKYLCLPLTALLLLAISGRAKAQPAQPAQQAPMVTIDHKTSVQNPVGLIQASAGQQFIIRVLNTVPECFDYNFEGVLPPKTQATMNARQAPQPLTEQNVDFNVTHDPQFGSYKITITAKDLPKGSTLKDQCDALLQKPQTYIITITTYAWTAGMAGAFTADKLTDPVFSLRAGTQNGQNGYFVEKDTGAEDSYRLGAAAMIHLYHSDPNRFSLSKLGVNWAPLSFGLGVDNDSQVHYFLGTSLKFGDQAFLTAGCVFGPRKRLPNGVHGFTTDQNALSSLPTKTSSAFFVGISYTFISISTDTFQNVFKQKTPTPEKKPES
jgi:hypothetical protein